MKIKFAFNKKNAFIYSYIALIIANIISGVILFSFLKKYVYLAINAEELININKNEITQDINMDNFNRIIDKINQKSKVKNYDNINDIFY